MALPLLPAAFVDAAHGRPLVIADRPPPMTRHSHRTWWLAAPVTQCKRRLDRPYPRHWSLPNSSWPLVPGQPPMGKALRSSSTGPEWVGDEAARCRRTLSSVQHDRGALWMPKGPPPLPRRGGCCSHGCLPIRIAIYPTTLYGRVPSTHARDLVLAVRLLCDIYSANLSLGLAILILG
ncbi:hypothetical protein AUP68_12686 [Ilyonectria robusta]